MSKKRPPTESFLGRLVAGSGAPTPATLGSNQAIVRAMERDMGIVGNKKAAGKIADVLGVHPDTVRRWRRGARPTLNPDLAKAYRRLKLSDKREARIRGGEFKFRAKVRVSSKSHVQELNLGQVMASQGRDIGEELADAWLEGDSLADIINEMVDEYSGGVGMEIEDIVEVTL